MAKMVSNPDPRPGRWLLPLVILGMVLFTYVFVRQLPGAEVSVNAITGTTTQTTSTTVTTTPGDTTGTTTTTLATDPVAKSYIDSLDALSTQLIGFQTEMASINAAWDADPKQIDFATGEQRFVTLSDQVAEWAATAEALTPPPGYEEIHGRILTAATVVAEESLNVIDGFRGPGSEPRIAAVSQFDQGVIAFGSALDAGRALAGISG